MTGTNKAMMVLMTDSASPDTSLERSLFSIAGIGFRSRQCAAEEGVVAEGAGCLACIAPTAPVTRAVFDALPELKLVTSLGESMDHIDLEAAKEHGVWVTNVPAKSTITLEDQRRAAVINVLSWLTHGKPTNVVVVGR
jgi:D-3-phosphoglycerate dehydrogenase